MMRRGVNHRGYVLILTLGLLVLASTLLVGVGRAAMRHTVTAREAQDDLQRRLGVMSCQNAILPRTEDILIRLEQQRKTPVPTFRTSIALGGQSFDLILADEQAKANVNGMLERAGKSGAESRLAELLTRPGIARAIRIRAAPPSSSKPSSGPSTQAAAPLVESFGQIFDGVSLEQLTQSRAGNPAAVDLVTCWGNGSLNVRRADEGVLKVASNPPLSGVEIAQLLRVRSDRVKGIKPLTTNAAGQGGADRVSRIFSTINQPGGGRAGSLVAASSCHSLWVVVRDGRRGWHYFTVRDRSDSQHPRTRSFVW